MSGRKALLRAIAQSYRDPERAIEPIQPCIDSQQPVGVKVRPNPVSSTRIVGCRPSGHRRGEVRVQSGGWSRSAIGTVRKKLDKHGQKAIQMVTIALPIESLSNQEAIVLLNDRLKKTLRKYGVTCMGIWEGPNPHCHILIMNNPSSRWISLLNRYLERFWRENFGMTMADCSFEFSELTDPLRLAQYLGKRISKGIVVKDRFEWCRFRPHFQVGLNQSRE